MSSATDGEADAEAGAAERAAGDPDGEEGPCAVVESLDRIGPKWRLVVLYDLQGARSGSTN